MNIVIVILVLIIIISVYFLYIDYLSDNKGKNNKKEIDDRNILRDTSRFLIKEETILLNEQIGNITDKYIISELLNGELNIDENTKLPVDDIEIGQHISNITEAVYSSLSQNYIDRLEYYAYRDIKLHIEVTVNKLFMITLNAIKVKKRNIAKMNLTNPKSTIDKDIRNIMSDIHNEGYGADDIITLSEEISYVGDIYNSGMSSTLPSTQRILDLYGYLVDRLQQVDNGLSIDNLVKKLHESITGGE